MNDSENKDLDCGAEGCGQAEVTQVLQELGELKEKYLRSLADYENLQKRHMKERADLLKYQGERIFLDLLEVVDSFELAMNYKEAQAEQLQAGVELIYKQLVSLLNKWDVKARSAVGEAFDPMTHSAISQVPAPEGVSGGAVVAELRKAFYYKDKLIRPGEVVVAAQ